MCNNFGELYDVKWKIEQFNFNATFLTPLNGEASKKSLQWIAIRNPSKQQKIPVSEGPDDHLRSFISMLARVFLQLFINKFQ
jgi:hypothetical protein